MMNSKIWIGLVGVVPAEENHSLGQDAGGAYTIVLGYALDRQDFTTQVTNALHTQGYEIFEIEDVEPFSKEIEKYEVTDEILELVREVELTNEFQCGTLHAFPRKSAN
jgi:hypothetical protein